MFSILKGWIGEKETQLGMWKKLDPLAYKRFHNVIFPTPRGTTQVDHVLLSVYGIFVVETKSHNGWIFGSEKSSHWTQSLYGEKFRFQNPLHQNYSHTKAVADFFADRPRQCPFDRFFHGRQCGVEDGVPAQCDNERAMCLHQKLPGKGVF